MSEVKLINDLLHSNPVKKYYTAKKGEAIRIELPQIPITRQTQFVGLKRETHGDVDSFVETRENDAGEGIVAPSAIQGKAVRSGTVNFTVKAIDRISGTEIADVEPLEITVDIEE